MMTGDEYRKSLDDGRSIFYGGERVESIAAHRVLGACVDSIAQEYDRFAADRAGLSAATAVPTTASELREHVEHHTTMTTMSHVTSTCVQTLSTAAGRLEASAPEAAAKILAYVEDARGRDIRITECITDAKGDRSLAPAAQPDPDAYTRVVERRPDGVVLRGAKLHITGASLGHEMMVIPTKAMRPGEEDYAIACMVPVAAPGVKIIDTTFKPEGDPEDSVFSSRYYFPEGFVIFDDVFVPNERVFLDGDTRQAAIFAHSLGLWERAGGLMNMAERADVLVGLAHMMAEANGLLKISHIKEKLTDMMLHASLVRATLEAAIVNCHEGPNGAVFPDELYVNAGKHFGAGHYNELTRNIWDICGGSLATAPGIADLRNPEVGPLLTKYMATGVDGEYRLRLLLAIRDLTAQDHGGWKAITVLQSGGGIHAQRTVLRKHYDIEGARKKAGALVDLPSTAPAAR